MQKNKITKNMLISEITQILPESQELMLTAGLHCVSCFAASFETFEQGMKGHGYSDAEIDEFVAELNLLYQETQKPKK